MKNLLTFEALADFCDTKGDEEFDWYDNDTCACAQYAAHIGLTDAWKHRKRYGFWSNASLTAVELPQRPRTFAALAARLRS